MADSREMERRQGNEIGHKASVSRQNPDKSLFVQNLSAGTYLVTSWQSHPASLFFFFFLLIQNIILDNTNTLMHDVLAHRTVVLLRKHFSRVGEAVASRASLNAFIYLPMDVAWPTANTALRSKWYCTFVREPFKKKKNSLVIETNNLLSSDTWALTVLA